MMPYNFPCRTCDHRYAGCHSECEDYKKAKEAHNDLKDKIFKQHKTQDDFFKVIGHGKKKPGQF